MYFKGYSPVTQQATTQLEILKSSAPTSSPLHAGAVVADGLGFDVVEVALVKRMVAVPAVMVPSMFTEEECAVMIRRTGRELGVQDHLILISCSLGYQTFIVTRPNRQAQQSVRKYSLQQWPCDTENDNSNRCVS